MKQKRRQSLLAGLLALALVLTACGGQESGGVPEERETPSPLEIARAVLDGQPNREDYVNQITAQDEDFPAFLEYCGVEAEAAADGAIFFAGGVNACEIIVLSLAEDAEMEGVEESLQAHRADRLGAFTGYAPEQAEVVKQSAVLTDEAGGIATLLICQDPDGAAETFRQAVRGELPAQPASGPAGEPVGAVLPAGTVPEKETPALTVARKVAGSQPNASDFTGGMVLGQEGFAERMALYGVETGDLADGALVWAGDGLSDQVLILSLKEPMEEKSPFLPNLCSAMLAQGIAAEFGSINMERSVYVVFAGQDMEAADDAFQSCQCLLEEAETFGPSAREVAGLSVASQPDAADYTVELASGTAEFDAQMEEYGLDPLIFSDGAIFQTEDGGEQIAILRHRSSWYCVEDHAKTMRAYMREKGYAAVIKCTGEYAFGPRNSDRRATLLVLFMCQDPEAAWTAFQTTKDDFIPDGETASSQEPEPERDERGYVVFHPPGNHDMTIYDTGAILEAHRSGDVSGLSDRDRATLEAAQAVLADCLTEGMTDYEKELAFHDWVVENLSYFWGGFGVEESEYASTPYGGLVEREGICLGYASTFQLLMDLAGVECMTVVGASAGSEEDHAWNLVRLDGEWYAVDTTWDDPTDPTAPDSVAVSYGRAHRYFNVTSDFLRETDHQWDYDAVPEAEGVKYAWTQP